MTAVGRRVNLARLPRHLQPTRWACVNSLFSAVCDRHRGGVAWVHVRRAVRVSVSAVHAWNTENPLNRAQSFGRASWPLPLFLPGHLPTNWCARSKGTNTTHPKPTGPHPKCNCPNTGAGDSRRDTAGVLPFWLLSTQGLDFYRSEQATARQGCVAGACGRVILENWGLRGAGLPVLRLVVRRAVVPVSLKS